MNDMMQFMPASSVCDAMLGDIKYNVEEDDTYPFMCRIGVIKYRPPRHEFFEWIKMMGMPSIDPILYHEKFDPSPTLTFIFPEAHMSVHEEHAFMHKLATHPEVDKIKQVDMITKSPMMVGNFKNFMVRVITWPEDEKYEKVGA